MERCVTVIVPAFNAARTVGRSIESALAQPEVGEVFVIDDASTDGTSQAAAMADDGSGRLKIHTLEKNSGPAFARNLAIGLASLPYIALLDSDDVFAPGRFPRLLAADDGNWDLAADNILFLLEEEGGVLPEMECGLARDVIHRPVYLDEFVQFNLSRPFHPRSEMGFIKPLMRREMLEQLHLSYDPDLRLGEDFVLYAQALMRGARLSIVSAVGYIALERQSSLSSQHSLKDLRALAAAEQRLIEEAGLLGMPKSDIEVLRRHLAETSVKVGVRELLDDARSKGRFRALISRMKRPRFLTDIIAALIKDRIASTRTGRRRSHSLLPDDIFVEEQIFRSR